MHDTLLQSFTALTLQMEGLSFAIAKDPDSAVVQLQSLLSQADHTLLEARSAVWDLRSPAIKSVGFLSALETAIRQFNTGDGPEALLVLSGSPVRLPPHLETTLLRIAEEASANAKRHARATQIAVELRFGQAEVVLRVCDDGCGFEPTRRSSLTKGHWGVKGMQERATQAGGSLHIQSSPGAGTQVEVIIPLPPGG